MKNKTKPIIFLSSNSFVFGEEEVVFPPRSKIVRMKRADLIAELSRQQLRMRSVEKRRDELHGVYLYCDQQLADSKRALQELEREHQLTMCQNQKLTIESYILRQQLQLAKSEALHRQSKIDKMPKAEEELEKIYEGNKCSICLSPWEAEGAHRMVSLKCGHLFGDSCIRQHLRRVHDCPYCKQPVGKRDIRYIFGCHVLLAANAAPSAQALSSQDQASVA